MIAVNVGPLSFPTKAAATEHFKTILHRQELGTRMTDPDATELLWLLERHPGYDRKVGAGIDYFFVRSNPEWPSQICFHLARVDGTSTDFSYLKCIDGKNLSHLSQAFRAMRAEVSEDIQDAKRRYFDENGGKVPCTVTGEWLTFDECHADHAPPRTFNTLARAWLAAKGIEPDHTFVIDSTDNQYQPRMRDPALITEWRTFHHKMAVIRIVAKRQNLKMAANSKVKKCDRQLILDGL
jgi:hypothetical protein